MGRYLLLSAVGLMLACGSHFDPRDVDEIESEIAARIGAAAAALQRLDGAALRAERDRLVVLRLRAEKLRLPAEAWEVRAGLLAALDAAADGLGVAATAVDLEQEAEALRSDPVQGKEIADRAGQSMELCRRRFEEALAALGRVHEARAKLEAR